MRGYTQLLQQIRWAPLHANCFSVSSEETDLVLQVDRRIHATHQGILDRMQAAIDAAERDEKDFSEAADKLFTAIERLHKEKASAKLVMCPPFCLRFLRSRCFCRDVEDLWAQVRGLNAMNDVRRQCHWSCHVSSD